MRRICRFVVCVGIFCLAFSTHARAELVALTSGFLLLTGPFAPGSISIAGTRGFSLEARVTPSEGRVDPMHLECSPLCLPGSVISVGAFQGGSSFVGTATLAGNSFDLSGGINDPAGVALEFFGTAMLPSMNDSSALATAPFGAFGQFSLPSGDRALMRGAGTVTLWLSPPHPALDLPRGWVVDQVRYDFSDAAPIPEPATLTLLGIGLAATALRARTRRKENV